jgi:hypothetical protein
MYTDLVENHDKHKLFGVIDYPPKHFCKKKVSIGSVLDIMNHHVFLSNSSLRMQIKPKYSNTLICVRKICTV